MKLLITMALALIFAVTTIGTVEAASTTVCKTVCKKKYKRHYYKKRWYEYSSCYYEPGYCVDRIERCGSCCGGYYRESCCEYRDCYAPRYYSCRTEYYYDNGHNMARVEVCD